MLLCCHQFCLALYLCISRWPMFIYCVHTNMLDNIFCASVVIDTQLYAHVSIISKSAVFCVSYQYQHSQWIDIVSSFVQYFLKLTLSVRNSLLLMKMVGIVHVNKFKHLFPGFLSIASIIHSFAAKECEQELKS